MNEIVDYARPCMMAELALKKAHHAMLGQDYDVAIGEALHALTETRLMINAIKDMKERQDALRK
jgi:hypothetical protein